MQKNLLLKTGIIVAILLIFVYGMLGPKLFSGEGFRAALLDRIHLGLDLKGGTHLILQVMVNDAVGAQSDHATEILKDELQKAKVNYADVGKLLRLHSQNPAIVGSGCHVIFRQTVAYNAANR